MSIDTTDFDNKISALSSNLTDLQAQFDNNDFNNKYKEFQELGAQISALQNQISDIQNRKSQYLAAQQQVDDLKASVND